MKRDHLVFLSAGCVVGFALGFAVAWGVSHPRASGPRPSPGARGDAGPAPPTGTGGQELMGQVFQTIQALKDRLEQDPADTEALLDLANLNLKVGKTEQARALLERLVAVDPDNLHGLTHLGLMQAEAQDLDGARDRFARTVEVDPSYWEGWFYLAVTEVRRGDLTAARDATERLGALKPDLPELAELRAHLREQGAR